MAQRPEADTIDRRGTAGCLLLRGRHATVRGVYRGDFVMEKETAKTTISDPVRLVIQCTMMVVSPLLVGVVVWFASFLNNSATKDDFKELRTKLATTDERITNFLLGQKEQNKSRS